MRTCLAVLGLFFVCASLQAQDRETRVRNDREAFRNSQDWIYNDLDAARRSAKEAGKPLLVVFRCVPCVACQKFDDEVARRDPIIRDLLEHFVCVRIVQANAIDLSHFQHDFDLSFAVYLIHPDLTIYGRFGTRSERPEFEDISLKGLRKAMEAALRMHREDRAVRTSLAGKQVRPARFKVPTDYPSLSGKYGPALNYEGQVTKSCIHCHQVREAERLVYRTAGEPLPDEVLYPYPDPAVLGLKLDPNGMATVERVRDGSIAGRAGLKVGDEIATLAGQPLLSIADVQWVLQNTPRSARVPAQVRRDGKTLDLTLDLPADWRRGDISWRATTWDLRRMGLGGLRLADLTDEQRAGVKRPGDAMALKVEHVGEYGEHAVAKRAGFRKGDLIVSFDGKTGRMSESDLLGYVLQQKKPGDEVSVTVLRDGGETTMRFALR